MPQTVISYVADPAYRERYGLYSYESIFSIKTEINAYYKLRYHYNKVYQTYLHVSALQKPPEATVRTLKKQCEAFFTVEGLMHYLEHYGINPGGTRKDFAKKVQEIVSRNNFFPIIDKKGKAFTPHIDDTRETMAYFQEQIITLSALIQYNIELGPYQRAFVKHEDEKNDTLWQTLAKHGVVACLGPVENTKRQLVEHYAGLMSRSLFHIAAMHEYFDGMRIPVTIEGISLQVSDVLLTAISTPFALIYLGTIQKLQKDDLQLVRLLLEGKRAITIKDVCLVAEEHIQFIQSVIEPSYQDEIEPIDAMKNVVRF